MFPGWAFVAMGGYLEPEAGNPESVLRKHCLEQPGLEHSQLFSTLTENLSYSIPHYNDYA